MAPLVAGYVLLAAFVAALPWRRASPGPGRDRRRDLRASSVLGLAHIIGLVTPMLCRKLRPDGATVPVTGAWIAIAAMVASLALQRRAQRALGRFFTMSLTATADQPIIDHGPYRWIRHPAYLSQIVVWISLGVSSRDLLVIATIGLACALAYGHRIVSEERMLMRELGESYRAYMKRTWRLLPLLW